MKKENLIENNYLKTKRLVETLDLIATDPLLSENVVIKGGCAVHFHLKDYKRLFFDVDIDIIDSSKRVEIKNRMIDICENFDMSLDKKARYSYSADSLVFRGLNESGNPDNIKYDLNYSFPNHVLEDVEMPLESSTFKLDKTIKTINYLELFAIKIKTFQERGNPKDLLDVSQFIKKVDNKTDLYLLRKMILFYYYISKRDYDLVSVDKVRSIDSYRANFSIGPLIPKGNYPDFAKIKKDYEEFIKDILIFTKDEIEFSKKFDRGIYEPSLLFDNKKIIERVENQPILVYKSRKNRC